LRRRADAPGALAASERAIRLFAHNGRFTADHGYNLLTSGRVHDAIDVLQGCRDLVSDSPHLSYWLAVAYLRAGDTARARAEAVNAYLLSPQNPEIFQLIWTIEDHVGAVRRGAVARDGTRTRRRYRLECEASARSCRTGVVRSNAMGDAAT
jgi:predicted Zn-dependent protease